MRTGRPKGNKIGSVYYDKRKKGWIAAYYLKDIETNKDIRKNKMFKTEDDAKKWKKYLMLLDLKN